jgi:hypothetical protein
MMDSDRAGGAVSRVIIKQRLNKIAVPACTEASCWNSLARGWSRQNSGQEYSSLYPP